MPTPLVFQEYDIIIMFVICAGRLKSGISKITNSCCRVLSGTTSELNVKLTVFHDLCGSVCMRGCLLLTFTTM